MITFGRAYIVDGEAYASLEAAQRAGLEKLFCGTDAAPIDICLANAAAIVNILTTKETSLPRARKANGGTKRRSTPAVAKTEAA